MFKRAKYKVMGFYSAAFGILINPDPCCDEVQLKRFLFKTPPPEEVKSFEDILEHCPNDMYDDIVDGREGLCMRENPNLKIGPVTCCAYMIYVADLWDDISVSVEPSALQCLVQLKRRLDMEGRLSKNSTICMVRNCCT